MPLRFILCKKKKKKELKKRQLLDFDEKNLRHSSLWMSTLNVCIKFQKLLSNNEQDILIQKICKKTFFFKYIIQPYGHQSKDTFYTIKTVLNSLYYVYKHIEGRCLSSKYCDHAKMGLIDCCLSLSSLTLRSRDL